MPSLRSQDRRTRSTGRSSASSSSRKQPAPRGAPRSSRSSRLAISDDEDDNDAAQEAALSGSVSVKRSRRPPPSAVRAAGGRVMVARPTRMSRRDSNSKEALESGRRSTRSRVRVETSSDEEQEEEDQESASSSAARDERPAKRRAVTREAASTSSSRSTRSRPSAVSLPAQPKRGPGRPRKHPRPASPPVVKRPRGRPSKAELERRKAEEKKQRKEEALRRSRARRVESPEDDDASEASHKEEEEGEGDEDEADWMDEVEEEEADEEEEDQLEEEEEDDDDADFGRRRRPRRSAPSPKKRGRGRPPRSSRYSVEPSRRSGRASSGRVSYAEPTASDIDELLATESGSDDASPAPRRPRSKRLAKKRLTRRSALASSSDEESDGSEAVRIQSHITVEAPEVDEDLEALFPMQENVPADPSGALPFGSTSTKPHGNRQRGRKARFAEPIALDDEAGTSEDEEQVNEEILVLSDSSDEDLEIGVAAEDKARKKRKTVLTPRRKPGAPDSDDEELALVVGEDISIDNGADPAEEEHAHPLAAHEKHWEFCQRCLQKPADTLLRKLYKTRDKLKALGKLPQDDDAKDAVKPVRGQRTARTALGAGVYDERVEASAGTRLLERIEEVEQLGGWVECATCSLSIHWDCQTSKRRRDALDEVNAVEEARWKALNEDEGDVFVPFESLEPGEKLNFVECVACFSASGWKCMLCQRDEWRHEQQGLLFRCKRCMRCSHYGCLQEISGDDDVETAAEGRQRSGWLCFDCEGWGEIEEILAWRPSAEAASRPEPKIPPGKRMPVYTPKHNLPREYLVKFRDASFREVQWVPHHWLALVDFNALRGFLAEGCRLELEPRKDDFGQSQRGSAKLGAASSQSRAVELLSSSQPALAGTRRSQRNTLALAEAETGTVEAGPPIADPDAAKRIPMPWKTPDRILDVFYTVDILGDDRAIQARLNAVANQRRGPAPLVPEEPREKFRKDPRLVHITEMPEYPYFDEPESMLPLVARVLIKWQDLGYEQATWESTLEEEEHADIWDDYRAAYLRFLASKRVYIPHRTRLELDNLDERRGIIFKPYKSQPEYVVGGRLLDFQLEGLNWLRYGWYRHQPGILADEMGLGKTIQVISFIACLHHDHKASPALVVVPNSTMANWLREFEKWTPSLRVVPYYGEASNRALVESYELFHDDDVEGREGLKTHVVLCSDSAARNIPWVLRRVQRWEVLIVDEGQSLKAGQTNKLHRNLAELPVAHRLIMTGTPLNNNIGELFNLLNWLHPGDQWSDLQALRQKYAFLTPELIAELQPKLRPYFLRRLKVNVVKDLPPKTELIVPIPMRPIQKRLYKSILESNIEDIAVLANGVRTGGGKRHVITKMNSILWLLRKCVQHPYLVSPYLEGDDRPPESGEAESKEDFQRLIDASSKLLFLKKLLPKLKAAGHRVLLFSQMVINLDIVEAFIAEMGYKSLRLDGSIGAKQRQRGIDAFNAPDSEVFIYLLSTRAGGIGINLASADTVIIYDPDFNPHQDNQAIARAHRIGQKKHVMVFSLVGKNTAEEQIVENARRKKVLDHVIVQNLQNEESGPAALEAVLKHGAQALFAEDTSQENERDTALFTDDDIDQLIRRASEVEEVTRDDNADAAGQFSFAQVWEHDEHAAAGGDEAMNDIGSSDFWTTLLEKSREAEQERHENEMRPDAVGRGKRKRVKTTFYVQSEHDVPRRKRKSGTAIEVDDEEEQRFTFDLQPIEVADDDDSDLDPDALMGHSSDDDLEGEVEEEDLLGIGGTPLKAAEPLRRRDWRIGIKARGRPTRLESEARARAQANQPKRPRGRPPNPNKAPRAPREKKQKVPKELRISATVARRILEATAQQHVIEIQTRQTNSVPVEPIKEPKDRPQLTQVHIAYFSKQLGFPPALFDWAFARVDSSQLPPSVQRLADEGAEFLDGAVVRRHLLNALHAMYAVFLENATRERRKEQERSRRKEMGRLTEEQAQQLTQAIDMLGADNLRQATRIAVEERDAASQASMVEVLLARAKDIQARYPADARLSLAVSSIDTIRVAQAALLNSIEAAQVSQPSRRRKQPANPANDLPVGTTLADHYADEGYDAFGDDMQAAGPSMAPPPVAQPSRPRPRPTAASKAAPPALNPDGTPVKRKPGRPRKSETVAAPVTAPPVPRPAPPPPPPPAPTARDLASSKRCPICTGSFHFLTKCPLVANLPQATKRYREMVNELKAEPTSEGRRMVTFLRSHLIKKGVEPSALPDHSV